MHHALVAVAVAFVLGLTLDGLITWPAAITWWNLAFLTMLAGMAHLAKLDRLASRLLLVGVLLAGLLRSQLHDPVGPTHFLRAAKPLSPPVRVLVCDDPEARNGSVRFLGKLVAQGGPAPVSGLVQVTLRSPGTRLPSYGDLLECPAVPQRLPELLPAEATSRLRVLRLQGVLGSLTAPADRCRVLEQGQGNFLVGWAYQCRHWFSDTLRLTHEARTANFLRSFILGEDAQLDPGLVEDFRKTGTIHVLSQSGQHVAILALVCLFSLRWLPIGRHLPAAMTGLVLLAYAVMTGGRPAVLRATLMAWCVIVGSLADRKTSPFNGLALAALVLLAWNPGDLYTAGFQLSFTATLALFVLTPWLMQFFVRFSTYGNSLIASSLAAWLGTAPLMAYHFGTLSVIGLAANLFVLPLTAVVMPTALLALGTAAVSTQVAYVFAAANFGFVQVLAVGLHWLARAPFAEVATPAPWPSLLLGYYLGLLAVAESHNLSRMLWRRQPDPTRKAANADWSWVLANRPMDPLMERLENLLDRQATLAPSEETLAGLRAKLGPELEAKLDPLTVEYLAFAAQKLQESGPSPDASSTAAVIATMMAVERELDARVFRYLKVPDVVARSEVARTHRRGHIGRPPRQARDLLSLPLQCEMLWYHLVPSDGAQRIAVGVLARELTERLERPAFYLDPARLALALDRTLKKFYLPICNGERFERTRALVACQEIVGGADHSLLSEIVAAGALGGGKRPGGVGT
ncbi:MAG: ComEC/Rec2 family competence protein [Candidatus Riflebacteria bacterium]|nr:ComEC/Rec2 family competence protein [Candidatus Riflebacteria bacterium]